MQQKTVLNKDHYIESGAWERNEIAGATWCVAEVIEWARG
jgi:hypothetical protein